MNFRLEFPKQIFVYRGPGELTDLEVYPSVESLLAEFDEPEDADDVPVAVYRLETVKTLRVNVTHELMDDSDSA